MNREVETARPDLISIFWMREPPISDQGRNLKDWNITEQAIRMGEC